MNGTLSLWRFICVASAYPCHGCIFWPCLHGNLVLTFITSFSPAYMPLEINRVYRTCGLIQTCDLNYDANGCRGMLLIRLENSALLWDNQFYDTAILNTEIEQRGVTTHNEPSFIHLIQTYCGWVTDAHWDGRRQVRKPGRGSGEVLCHACWKRRRSSECLPRIDMWGTSPRSITFLRTFTKYVLV